MDKKEYKKQLSAGTEVEKEHKETLTTIIKKVKPDVTASELNDLLKLGYRMIAGDHLDEFDTYYIPYLRDMERELEALKETKTMDKTTKSVEALLENVQRSLRLESPQGVVAAIENRVNSEMEDAADYKKLARAPEANTVKADLNTLADEEGRVASKAMDTLDKLEASMKALTETMSEGAAEADVLDRKSSTALELAADYNRLAKTPAYRDASQDLHSIASKEGEIAAALQDAIDKLMEEVQQSSHGLISEISSRSEVVDHRGELVGLLSVVGDGLKFEGVGDWQGTFEEFSDESDMRDYLNENNLGIE